MKPAVAFLLNLDFTEEFFKRCQKLNPDTREARESLLIEMSNELKVVRMNEEDLTRFVKNKRIAVIKKKGE